MNKKNRIIAGLSLSVYLCLKIFEVGESYDFIFLTISIVILMISKKEHETK